MSALVSGEQMFGRLWDGSLAIPMPRPSHEAVDALVDESIDGFSTHALGDD